MLNLEIQKLPTAITEMGIYPGSKSEIVVGVRGNQKYEIEKRGSILISEPMYSKLMFYVKDHFLKSCQTIH